MKISYILQLKDFCILLIFGIIIGIAYEILKIPTIIKKHIILQIITDIIWSISTTILFIFLINKINMGQIRLFLLMGYVLGFAIERITLGKLFAKEFGFVYTKLVKFNKYLLKSKFGKVIFK